MDLAPVLTPLLFREGPFDAATLHPRIRDNKGGCDYRFTTYLDYDYAVQDGLLGVQIHHPRFLERVGAPESARLLRHALSEWIRSLTRLQTIDAARQLQRVACLMTSNLSILDQYALSLHETASDMLELVVGRQDFKTLDTTMPVPRVRHASTHMEAMGLWRPPHGSGGRPPHGPQGPPCTGYPPCTP